MAHLFTLDASQKPGQWKLISPADGVVFTLPHDVQIRQPGGPGAVQPFGGPNWYILSPSDVQVRVNGERLLLGSRLVKHRDEIVVDGHRFFFSTERLAAVGNLPALGHAVHCARCKQPVEQGSLAVSCPGCGAWHHQSDALACWCYDAKCALCDSVTELGGGFRWTPDQEGWL